MTTTVVSYVTQTLAPGESAPVSTPPAPTSTGSYHYPPGHFQHPGMHQNKGNVPTDKNNWGYRGNPNNPKNPNYGHHHESEVSKTHTDSKPTPKPSHKSSSKQHDTMSSKSVTHHTHTSSPSSKSIPYHTGSGYSETTHTPVSSSNDQDSGMSGGAKAGLAIGLILAIGLVAGLVFLFYRKKKNNGNDGHQQLDDEKSGLNASNGFNSRSVSVRRTVTNAPRLSLRPVTELFQSMSEKEDAHNHSAGSFITNSAASAQYNGPQTLRTPETSPDDSLNPFGDHAETADIMAPAAAAPKPLSVKSERTGTGISESAMPNGQPAAGAQQNPRRLSPPGPGPNNVHRVQLDFNPSMDDELGLRAGQLVRMLHEYDDGWALCIRLDRSQQGVVPRTCLSKLPVKPRPQGPPPAGRGIPPPQGRPRGPTNGLPPRGPSSGRVRAQSNGPRQGRPESPGPMAGPRMGGPAPRARSNSDAVAARRITPPGMAAPVDPNSTSPTQGNAVPNRKPVPGQAM